jgi:hypothetical protein
MGIKVQQRSLAFNAPSGAEHTIFFIYRFTNVTNDPAFQQANEARFGNQLPDAGWTINNIYAAFAMDPDVTTHAGDNFSTAILPLNMGIAYHALFQTDDFNFAARPVCRCSRTRRTAAPSRTRRVSVSSSVTSRVT